VTETLHPHVATLLKAYARELADTEPSPSLDARIDRLVAADRKISSHPVQRPDRRRHVLRWSAAACLALVAIVAGIAIGMRLERDAPRQRFADADSVREPPWPRPELSMWPTDSVALKIPAEYAPDGTLVAVDSRHRGAGARYWVDVIVSNDGTVRIERVVPAGPVEEPTAGVPDVDF
jgi:hypothetical protein